MSSSPRVNLIEALDHEIECLNRAVEKAKENLKTAEFNLTAAHAAVASQSGVLRQWSPSYRLQ